jgi:magnesium transporter
MMSDALEIRPLSSTSDIASLDGWQTLSEDERVERFQALSRGDASELFLALSPDEQEALITALPANERRVWLRLLAPDDAADVIQQAPEEERGGFLDLLDQRTRIEVEALLAYKADVAGGRMSPSYAWVRPGMTAAQAQAYVRLQAADRISMVYYAYVLDSDEYLRGVVSFRELMTAPAARRVDEIMLRDFVSVPEDMDQEAVAHVLAERDLLAVPVVDSAGRMKGIVTVDDVIDVVQQEATEDIQKIGGSEALSLPYFRTRPAEMLRKRAGWLSLLFLSEMLTATAMGFFEHEIETAVVLAIFVPLVISSGGNSGSQASTLIIRAMALGEVRLRDWWRVVRREIGFGLSLGAILAVIGAIRITAWQAAFGSYGDHAFQLGATVCLSLIGVVAWGTISGSMLPIALRKAGFDPANASAPLVATLCDVTGLVIYFSIAKLILLKALE